MGIGQQNNLTGGKEEIILVEHTESICIVC